MIYNKSAPFTKITSYCSKITVYRLKPINQTPLKAYADKLCAMHLKETNTISIKQPPYTSQTESLSYSKMKGCHARFCWHDFGKVNILICPCSYSATIVPRAYLLAGPGSKVLLSFLNSSPHTPHFPPLCVCKPYIKKSHSKVRNLSRSNRRHREDFT